MNAYEHGNLGIDMETKHKMIRDNTYEEFLSSAEKKCHKKIKLKYGLYETSGKKILGVTVIDEGEGFQSISVIGHWKIWIITAEEVLFYPTPLWMYSTTT